MGAKGGRNLRGIEGNPEEEGLYLRTNVSFPPSLLDRLNKLLQWRRTRTQLGHSEGRRGLAGEEGLLIRRWYGKTSGAVAPFFCPLPGAMLLHWVVIISHFWSICWSRFCIPILHCITPFCCTSVCIDVHYCVIFTSDKTFLWVHSLFGITPNIRLVVRFCLWPVWQSMHTTDWIEIQFLRL